MIEHLIQTGTKFAPQLLVLAFLIITFLTSALDKILDWNGNIAYFNDHFKNTFMKGKSSLMLGFIALMELVASILCIVGLFQIYSSGSTQIGFWGAVISAKTLLMLLLGQRVAKDYAGAMTIAVYFMVAVYGVSLLA
ncbi:MAG: DoxX family membrane protein [Flavobacteriaceae bacterium]